MLAHLLDYLQYRGTITGEASLALHFLFIIPKLCAADIPVGCRGKYPCRGARGREALEKGKCFRAAAYFKILWKRDDTAATAASA